MHLLITIGGYIWVQNWKCERGTNKFLCSFSSNPFTHQMSKCSFFILASLHIITHHLLQMPGSHHLERSAQHLQLSYGGQGWTRIPQLLFHLVLFPLSISSYRSIIDSFQEEDVIYMPHFSNPQFTPWAVILNLFSETFKSKAAVAPQIFPI